MSTPRKPPTYRMPVQPMVREEILHLLATCGKSTYYRRRIYALILLMWRAQLRLMEACKLHIDDVNFDDCSLTVQSGKGMKRRVVGFDEQTRDELLEFLRTRSPKCNNSRKMFAGYTDSYPSKRRVGEMFRKLGKAAGITKRVHPHSLRHSGAIELLREKVPITMIQQQLGHANLSTTAIYLRHICPAELIDLMRVRKF